ncbi:nudix/7,8-dihydro-8-oxoguanine triphosphatase [Volvox carteri f. nagariensis]|uniref:Oxidized purine nucleoside triphosphate hydrolase n=1 Tax=Volvox carteri f. nagariensis TaxID=3068 RepID=D8U4B8_VOLCA|nr:nudix/7,8-dihydro-8-oxoguanine triphosphatase [Volvox carteri f. nagariensis]EFJ45375.1 nudix/7,8-dihydro-8-oxoguanine triphosphatase [Volvox carteri f. nagariensis]|eukprot:XP_002953402.1 nudix/7,8-dihydro-8-oxoguanine triphosphatase [Volvox carteri f. nagariensis]
MQSDTDWAVEAVQHASSAPDFAIQKLLSGTHRKLLTLVVINDGARVLLGLKKRGFGAGFYNGFGGKVDPGETIEEAAQRELQEEACITAELKDAGVLVFVFDDQPQPWEVHVFTASSYVGEPAETDEMRPQWFTHTDVPFDSMWADDLIWYPYLLRHEYFRGVFAFRQTTKLAWHTMLPPSPDS